MLPYPESEIREFYKRHRHSNPADLLLSASAEEREKVVWMVEQMKSRNRIQSKLPEWAERFDLILPPEGNLSQSSSTITAIHKEQYAGRNHLDLTAGSGVDAWRMGRNADSLTIVEPNSDLLATTCYNLKKLGLNPNGIQSTAEEFLASSEDRFDSIFIDPSRKSDDGSKTVALHRMVPDLSTIWDRVLSQGSMVCVKLSPLFDITAIQRELSHVKTIEVISWKNEVKEILITASQDHEGAAVISASELDEKRKWTYTADSISGTLEIKAGKYLYDPSPALIKANLHAQWAAKNGLTKLIEEADLYFDEVLHQSYPGRVFEVKQIGKPYKLKELPQRLSIVSRYYYEKPEVIRKKLKVGESDEDFLFALGKTKNERTFIHAVRIV